MTLVSNLSGITQPTDFQEWLSYVRQESLQKPQYCSSRIWISYKTGGPGLIRYPPCSILIWPGIWTSIPSSVFKSYCIPIVKPLSVCPAPFIRTRIPIAAPITAPIVSSTSTAPPWTAAASTTASATSSTTITATHSFLLLLNSLYYIIWDG